MDTHHCHFRLNKKKEHVISFSLFIRERLKATETYWLELVIYNNNTWAKSSKHLHTLWNPRFFVRVKKSHKKILGCCNLHHTSMSTGQAPEKSNFSQRCSLLSRYLKEKGSFGNINMGLARKSDLELAGKFDLKGIYLFFPIYSDGRRL